MIDSSPLQFESSKTPCPPPCSPLKQPKQKWYYKFSNQAEEPGKEKWRDASLSDKERWKEWHKAKDRERKAGYNVLQYKSPIQILIVL